MHTVQRSKPRSGYACRLREPEAKLSISLSLNLYVHNTYIYIYTNMYVCMCIHIYIYIHMNMYVYRYTCIRITAAAPGGCENVKREKAATILGAAPPHVQHSWTVSNGERRGGKPLNIIVCGLVVFGLFCV